MLIGLIADGTKEKTDRAKEGYTLPSIFGFGASIFLPFIRNVNISISTSNQNDPYELYKYDNLEKIGEIMDQVSAFTVKIFSYK